MTACLGAGASADSDNTIEPFDAFLSQVIDQPLFLSLAVNAGGKSVGAVNTAGRELYKLQQQGAIEQSPGLYSSETGGFADRINVGAPDDDRFMLDRASQLTVKAMQVWLKPGVSSNPRRLMGTNTHMSPYWREMVMKRENGNGE